MVAPVTPSVPATVVALATLPIVVFDVPELLMSVVPTIVVPPAFKVPVVVLPVTLADAKVVAPASNVPVTTVFPAFKVPVVVLPVTLADANVVAPASSVPLTTASPFTVSSASPDAAPPPITVLLDVLPIVV